LSHPNLRFIFWKKPLAGESMKNLGVFSGVAGFSSPATPSSFLPFAQNFLQMY
jgi:hypothetical protein